MTDLLKKRLKLIFEDGFLISRYLFDVAHMIDEPRFFDSVETFSIFGDLLVSPIKGAVEVYYEKVEVDAFREFVINWDPRLADFDSLNLSVEDVPKVVDVVRGYTPEERRAAIIQFYGFHYINVVNLVKKWLAELPRQPPYQPQLIKNMRDLKRVVSGRFKIETLAHTLPQETADALITYWIGSPMNYITKPFGPFEISPYD